MKGYPPLKQFTHDRGDHLDHRPPPDAVRRPAGQRAAIEAALHHHEQGRSWPGVIEHGGATAGRIDLNNILRGPLRSCFLGYWVARPLNARGIATDAVRQALAVAFDDLGLHRVDAFARVDNPGSRRVLEKNGFRTVGISRRHIHIAGRWRDDVLFQKLAPWDDGVRLDPPAGVSPGRPSAGPEPR